MRTRRHFIQVLPLVGWSALTACGDKAAPPPAVATPAAAPSPAPAPAEIPTPVAASAAPGPMVDPSDATAVALGYVPDATATKDQRHLAGSACSNCALFGGKTGDASGQCPLYAGKQVAASGWCSGYSKKA